MSSEQITLDGESEPWKDAETLRGLYKDRTQAQVAEWFQQHGHDVTASTISYWMKKLEVNTSHTKHDESERSTDSQKCMNHDECGNHTPGANNTMCVSCLDEARQRQREKQLEERKRAERVASY